MKTSFHLLAAMALLAVAALGANGVHVDDNPIAHHSHDTNHLIPSEPVADERTWVPFRALRAMDSPKQGPNPHDDGKHAHPHQDLHHDSKKDVKQAPHALGQAHVTPAPTIPITKASPSPTKTNTPRATPASTTTRATPRPTTTSSSTHKVASPPANKKPKGPGASATKQGKTGASSTSNAVQQKTRNLGGNKAKQQPDHDCDHHGAKQGVKKGGKHQ
ncbi:hypothetical protein PHYSODRAFT_297782 [Phytophthora sojae]|uniref:RxLR effector protein n=1 Tax=Phytophthora sojae (strain P6497) TaxID=1094619 RepID=G4Z8T3_PHYSP|nr:hypothetical protein PHYSODRAFT_247073 [Phytophthora sojae]XP_009521832.1 hypothetical protein PHYSODRAFT_297782 [Phytophthora sojae]EGZ19113.1 hypothetical protein PHYSODRAFT_247073 [Phytophthora sojae]EGZ19115.1 hypothetical protein PHYSODRAFT_297782 [Phytophthora sojae]|eukprot:XP_009521830.1 hypothetical protein PHYSODRAFT_247073 [Phytophthora sojae]